MIVSLLTTLFNLGWNVFNLRRSDTVRLLDHRRSAFLAQVGIPVEACLAKFENFVLSLQGLDRQFARLSPDGEQMRVEAYEKLQRDTFEPAMGEFQMTLRRVAAVTEPVAGGVDWLAFEDVLDPVRTNFDALCRNGGDPDRLKTASQDTRDVVARLCQEMRSTLSPIAMSLASVSGMKKASREAKIARTGARPP